MACSDPHFGSVSGYLAVDILAERDHASAHMPWETPVPLARQSAPLSLQHFSSVKKDGVASRVTKQRCMRN